jgi:DNA-binding CsgD family transcriptional regulator
VLALIAQGYTDPQIGELLGISYKTVCNTGTRILHNLGAKTRSHAELTFRRRHGRER